MQRFARNTIEIMGNVICRHFQDATIKQVSGVKLLTEGEKQQVQAYPQLAQQAQQMGAQPPPPPDDEVQELLAEPSWEQVLGLLRDNPDRSFRIDIETDSTIEMDAGQDRDEAMQFLQAVGGFLKEAINVPPSLAPLTGAMLEFGVRKWRVGRTLESMINKTVEDLEKAAQNPPQTPPDPAMMKVQQDGQLQNAKMQADQQGKAAELAANQQIEQAKLEGQQAIEAQKLQGTMRIEQIKAQNEATKIQNDAAMAQMQAENTRALAEQQAAADDARERDRMGMEMQFNRRNWRRGQKSKSLR